MKWRLAKNKCGRRGDQKKYSFSFLMCVCVSCSCRIWRWRSSYIYIKPPTKCIFFLNLRCVFTLHNFKYTRDDINLIMLFSQYVCILDFELEKPTHRTYRIKLFFITQTHTNYIEQYYDDIREHFPLCIRRKIFFLPHVYKIKIGNVS